MQTQKLDVLKTYFGYEVFRQGQERLIDQILEGRDTLGIMPTGAGKSICFQLPAMMFEGITLVVSPLISLMKDQVTALNQAGIRAAYLNSSLTQGQYAKALENARNNTYKIIYIAPERLLSPEFIKFAKCKKIAMITIDEAHCVSQWGQDFRPSYTKITQFIAQLSESPILSAFTATATTQVREDIIDKLKLFDPYVLTTGFDRANLFFGVRKPKDKFAALASYVKENHDKCGIVYCSTRKTVEQVSAGLQSLGYEARGYHAGMSDGERSENQDAFIFDRCKIIVATNAFGMGIDKSNVSFVIHYNMPKNIESYYQEAGRAGRDGEPAECWLYFGEGDVATNKFLIERGNANGDEEMDIRLQEAIKEKDRQLLQQMTAFCHSNECLREYLLNYFGETTVDYCGNCSSCTTDYQTFNATEAAQKIILSVKRTSQRFGMRILIDALRGSKNKKITNFGLNRLDTYGALAEMPEQKLRNVFNDLIRKNLLRVTADQYPIVKLTERSCEVLQDDFKLTIKIRTPEKEQITAEIVKNARELGGTTTTTAASVDNVLFTRLREARKKIATEQKVPAYVVFSDAALKDMCAKKPTTPEKFLSVSGVGQHKLDLYGTAFLAEISDFVSEKKSAGQQSGAMSKHMEHTRQLTYPDQDKNSAKIKQNEHIDHALFEQLLMLRKRIADSKQLDEYMVFSKDSLREMCVKLPRNPEELSQIKGFGEARLAQYGGACIDVILQYLKNK